MVIVESERRVKVKAVSGIMLTMLLTSILTLAFSIQPAKSESIIWTVDDDFQDYPYADFTKIQEAVDAAYDEDTIIVYQGKYIESVNVYKVLAIRGIDYPVVDGNGSRSTISITANEVILQGFNVTNSGYSSEPHGGGIELNDVENCSITDNNIYGNFEGISLINSNYNTVMNNRCANNSNNGIRLWSQTPLTSKHNLIYNNTCFENKWAGILSWSYVMTTTTTSYNKLIKNRCYSNSQDGISIGNSIGNVLSENNCSYNDGDGISLDADAFDTNRNNNVTNNIISNNKYYGISLYGPYGTNTQNIIVGNMIADNLVGVSANGVHNNKFYHNNIIENSFQAIVSGTNVWDDGYPSGGNYWSDFEDRYPGAEEIDNSGIWNTPYYINENNQDDNPLVNPIQGSLNLHPTASFTYDPRSPTVGENIVFNASSSYDLDGRIVSYQWNFSDGSTAEGEATTHSYASKDSYPVILIVTDNDGATDMRIEIIDITVQRPPIIFVHGFQTKGGFNPVELWSSMSYWLTGDTNPSWVGDAAKFEGNGFIVYISNYTHDTSRGTLADIRYYARSLAKEIEKVKQDTGANKVDIVAHSMGGLVARTYIEGADFGDYGIIYKHDVRKLVMLGTPNHGGLTGLLRFLPLFHYANYVCAFQMKLGSAFLNTLNYGDPETNYFGWHPNYEMDKINAEVEYYTIAGNRGFPALDHDGLVSVGSAKLDGTLNFVFPVDHSGLRTDFAVFQKVKEILRDEVTYSYYRDPIAQQAPTIFDKISQSEQKSHEIPVSSSVMAEFSLCWPEGSLNLTLITPSGTIISPSSAASNGNIFYYEGTDLILNKGFMIENPEQGIWKVNVTAVNIIEEQEYMIITFLGTYLALFLELQKYEYDPDEPMQIRANLVYGNATITDGTVTATILKPDNTTGTIMLYDDGLHNDNRANDDIYANTWTSTSFWGTYDITVIATGSLNGEQFAREAFATVWVEQYPDLCPKASEVYFSNENPVEGETIKINATIYNVGETDANNASILFYDGNPANGTLIGEYTINVTAGGAENACIQWNTTCGAHQIHVLISPYNEFLELNYTNNIAQRTIEVTITGDADRDGKIDASDLFKLSKAYGSALGDSNWDESCDFNGDDKVDDSDLSELNKNYGKTV